MFYSLRVLKERRDCTRIILFSSLLFVCPKREEITHEIKYYIKCILFSSLLFSFLRVSRVQRKQRLHTNYYIKYISCFILFSSLLFA